MLRALRYWVVERLFASEKNGSLRLSGRLQPRGDASGYSYEVIGSIGRNTRGVTGLQLKLIGFEQLFGNRSREIIIDPAHRWEVRVHSTLPDGNVAMCMANASGKAVDGPVDLVRVSGTVDGFPHRTSAKINLSDVVLCDKYENAIPVRLVPLTLKTKCFGISRRIHSVIKEIGPYINIVITVLRGLGLINAYIGKRR
jgi:hypothetical protein